VPGSLPSELGTLTDMHFFATTNNDFSGTLPTEFGNLKSLEQLWPGNNYYSGAIQTKSGRLSLLEKFHAWDSRNAGDVDGILCKGNGKEAVWTT